jgi:hypothetical protein
MDAWRKEVEWCDTARYREETSHSALFLVGKKHLPIDLRRP